MEIFSDIDISDVRKQKTFGSSVVFKIAKKPDQKHPNVAAADPHSGQPIFF